MLLTPIVAFVLAAMVRGIVPTPLQGLGILLVVAGLVLNTIAGRKATTKVVVPQVHMAKDAVAA